MIIFFSNSAPTVLVSNCYDNQFYYTTALYELGAAQWSSVRHEMKGSLVRDLRPEALFCVFEQTLYPLLRTGSTQEDRKAS